MILPDWISGFYTLLVDKKKAPPLFAKWASAFVIGAVAQRKVWALSRSDPIYPNLYVMLVAPPGVGKGVSLVPAARMLSSVPGHNIAPASLTSAALADELADAHTSFFSKSGLAYQYSPLTIVSRDLQVFLPEFDRKLLGLLTDMYDNEGYDERRRGSNTGKRLEIPGAHVSLIAGTQPAYLSSVLPDGAFELGFMSRVIIVYEGHKTVHAMVEELESEDNNLIKTLSSDLTEINERDGRIYWDQDALDAYNKWLLGGMKPAPTHPKLIGYCERRHYNLVKLVQIFCLSRGGETLSKDDFEMALDLLLETEAMMPDAFRAMRTGGDQIAIKEAFHYMMQMYAKRGHSPVPKRYLFEFLGQRVASHSVPRIIEVMIQGGMLRDEQVNKVGLCFTPIRPGED